MREDELKLQDLISKDPNSQIYECINFYFSEEEFTLDDLGF